jgi:Tfp pilus assembly protein PilF
MKRIILAYVLVTSVLLGACATSGPPLVTPPGADPGAAKHNAEGIEHYNLGHWDVAKEHFEAAVKADPKLAEAHYNLALAFHKLGAHAEATAHFKKAAELAPSNTAITDSSAYRSHVRTSSDYGGGYGGYGGMSGY